MFAPAQPTPGTLFLTNARQAPIITLLALVAIGLGTGLAIFLIPEFGRGSSGLFASALAMSLGLLAAPVAACLDQPRMILRGEFLLTLAPIYWLLLDLLQGVYSMATIETDQI